ncbi:VWA domain-containing protein [Streptosporangium lutulentum]
MVPAGRPSGRGPATGLGERRALPQGPGEDDPAPQDVLPGDGTRASALSTYGSRDFGPDDERRRSVMRDLEAAWPAVLPWAPSRRRRPARSGDRLDMRHIWRRAHRHDGEIVELRRRARPPRPRRLLILVDVSGSLRQHTPDLLRLAHTALRAARPAPRSSPSAPGSPGSPPRCRTRTSIGRCGRCRGR